VPTLHFVGPMIQNPGRLHKSAGNRHH